jgi:hypothetical protein
MTLPAGAPLVVRRRLIQGRTDGILVEATSRAQLVRHGNR